MVETFSQLKRRLASEFARKRFGEEKAKAQEKLISIATQPKVTEITRRRQTGVSGGGVSRSVQVEQQVQVQKQEAQRQAQRTEIIMARAKQEAIKSRKRISLKRSLSNILSSEIKRRRKQLSEDKDKISKFLKKQGFFKSGKLKKDQEKLNKDIEDFNKQFEGKELNLKDFNKAENLSEKLDKRQRNILKEGEQLKRSPASKIKKFIFGDNFVELTPKAEESLKTRIKQRENKIKELKKKGKSTFLESKFLQGDKATLRRGGDRILTGDVPIVPVGTPGAIAKGTKILFSGKQVTRGNKIITDLKFVANGRKVGVAKGVTLIKGKKGLTVVAGKFGRKGVSFPSAKTKIKGIRSFVGREASITKQAAFKLKTKLTLLNKAKKAGKINVIKKNIDGLRQVGIGRSAVVRGNKFIRTGVKFPSGKLQKFPVRNVNKDTFASVSAVFTKKELSKIIGKTITLKGNKANFIGIIKGEKSTRGLSSLSSSTKLQYQQALNKVIGTVSSAVAKTSKLPVSQAAKIANAAITSVSKIQTKIIQPAKVSAITKKQQTNSFTPKQINLLGKKIKTEIKARQKQVQTLSIRPLTKTVSKLKQKELTRTRTKQLSRQIQRLRQAQKQVQTQINKARLTRGGRVIVPNLSTILFPLIILKKGKRKRVKKIKKQKAFNVLARPLKKKGQKKRPKLIKVNKVPLKKTRAKDLRNYIVDTSLSRTSRIKKTKGKPKKTKLKVPLGYAKRTRKKFRTYKIVKGKKIKLPKGKVIERSRNLLDTKQEKRKITLKRRIAQIRKPKKRKLSQKQLSALRKGRMKLRNDRK